MGTMTAMSKTMTITAMGVSSSSSSGGSKRVGRLVGSAVGMRVMVGSAEGPGEIDGASDRVGLAVGAEVGSMVGSPVGKLVGTEVGEFSWLAVGETVVTGESDPVGAIVCPCKPVVSHKTASSRSINIFVIPALAVSSLSVCNNEEQPR